MKKTDSPKRRSFFLRILSSLFRRAWYSFRNPRGGYLEGHPELELFSTDEQRRLAQRYAASKIIFKLPFFIAAGAAVVLSLVTNLLLRWLVASLGLQINISQTLVNLIIALPVTIFCILVALWLLSRHVSKHLRHELLGCGVPICISCGYALIGAPGPNCPECGRPFDEQVQRILDLNTGDSKSDNSVT